MTRAELTQYINNCILLGNIITEESDIYQSILNSFKGHLIFNILGAVNVDGIYVKLDEDNKTHLVYYTREDEGVDLSNLIDIIDEDAFAWNKTVRSISGKSVTKIGTGAFYHSFVEKINFPNVVEIGEEVFYRTGVKKVVLNKLNVVPMKAFAESDIVSFRGDNVKVVEAEAFRSCIYLERVAFPNLITIGESAFYNSSITDVVFNKVKKIPLHAFMGARLRSFKGDEVEVVGEGGFQYCEYLKRLILPKVKKIHLGYCENTYEEGKWIADLQMSKDCSFIYKY